MKSGEQKEDHRGGVGGKGKGSGESTQCQGTAVQKTEWGHLFSPNISGQKRREKSECGKQGTRDES